MILRTHVLLLLVLLMLVVSLLVPRTPADAATRCRPVIAGGAEGRLDDDRAPATGTLRIDLLFVDFPDAVATESVANASAGFTTVVDTLNAGSGGQLQATMGMIGWLRMPEEQASYDMVEPLSFGAQWGFVRDAVAAAGERADLTATDAVVVVPTRRATAMGATAASSAPLGQGAQAGEHEVRHSVVLGHDTVAAWHATAVHEVGHVLGLPDLYAIGDPNPHRGVGGWGLMGSVPSLAPDLLGWHKLLLGWTDTDDVICLTAGDDVVLRPNNATGGTRLGVIQEGHGVVHALEYRDGTGLDAPSCSTGLLAYRVDQHGNSGEAPVMVHGAREPSGDCRGTDMAARGVGEHLAIPGTALTVQVIGTESGGLRIKLQDVEHPEPPTSAARDDHTVPASPPASPPVDPAPTSPVMTEPVAPLPATVTVATEPTVAVMPTTSPAPVVMVARHPPWHRLR